MTLQASGYIDMGQINAQFGRGLNLGAYRGTAYWLDNNVTQFAFSNGQINFSDFYSKRATSPSNPGSWDQGTPGTYGLTVPFYGYYFRLQAWGAGGAGGCANLGGAGGGSGGLGLSAAGGGGGGRQYLDAGVFYHDYYYGGAGGGASGGNEANNAGASGGVGKYDFSGFQDGLDYSWSPAGSGGAGANGGGGGAGAVGVQLGSNPGDRWYGGGGNWPGGGGGGGGLRASQYTMYQGQGGGGGGYVQGIWYPGQLTVGAGFTIVVGAGAAGADGIGGSGANGRVLLSWS